MSNRQQVAKARRWVVKVGSSLVTNNGRGLNVALISAWVEQIAALRQRGIEVVLVSSGAVAEGVTRMGWSERPHALHQLQAAAAIGQMGLVHAYESRFQMYGMHTALVLLTHDDLVDRRRYLNARSTLRSLLQLNVIPVINENDTVAFDEIRFGDNDSLAALVTNLLEADLLVLLTDQDGMYEADPRQQPDAAFIYERYAGDESLKRMAAGGGVGKLGRGGMLTKVEAAEKAARSGAATLIAPGAREGVLLDIADGERIGTLILPASEPLLARKQWLAGHMQLRGQLVLDVGAVNVLRDAGRSLLAVGVCAVKGEFERGEMVACIDEAGREIARGLVNYSAEEARKMMGHSSDKIESLLGYVGEPELIHRDNLVLC